MTIVLTTPDPTVVEWLRQVLKGASARYTQVEVACLLAVGDRVDSHGANEEGPFFHHAEQKAVERLITSRRPIDIIHIMSSREGHEGLKRAMPCSDCTRRLGQFAREDAVVHLYEGTGRLGYKLPLKEIVLAYEMASITTLLLSGSVDAIVARLPLLTPIDRQLLAAFLTCLDEANRLVGFSVYLTGTAAIGGPRALLNKQVLGVAYQDLDLVIIGDRLPDDVLGRAYFEALRSVGIASPDVEIRVARQGESAPGQLHADQYWVSFSDIHLGDALAFDRVVLYDRSLMTQESNRKDSDKPSTIELSLGNRLSTTLSAPYLQKGWYILLRID